MVVEIFFLLTFFLFRRRLTHAQCQWLICMPWQAGCTDHKLLRHRKPTARLFGYLPTAGLLFAYRRLTLAFVLFPSPPLASPGAAPRLLALHAAHFSRVRAHLACRAIFESFCHDNPDYRIRPFDLTCHCLRCRTPAWQACQKSLSPLCQRLANNVRVTRD